VLSKIENGTISPSLATLGALAKALNVSISSLFAETDEQRDCSFVKSGQGVRIERRGTKAGHLYDLLGHSLAGEIAVEPFLITLKQDAQPYTNFRHAGVEFIYMFPESYVIATPTGPTCSNPATPYFSMRQPGMVRKS
jgi:transcriptional regulator with XRE-family HTH domain